MAKARRESDLPRTVEAFVAWHALQPERWELIGGAPVMMSPASLPHTIIKGNIFRHLANRLNGGPCRAYVDGAEIRSHQFVAIPDIAVQCSAPDLRSPTLTEPAVVIEVLSPSSERDDISRKWHGYCLIPSLRHYLVVAQEQSFVTLHTRTGPSAFTETVHQTGTIDFAAIAVSLTLDEIYEGVTFPPEPGTAGADA